MDHDRRRGRVDGDAHRCVRADPDSEPAVVPDADDAAAAELAATALPDADAAAAKQPDADQPVADPESDVAGNRPAADRTSRSVRREAAPHRGARVAQPADVAAGGLEAAG